MSNQLIPIKTEQQFKEVSDYENGRSFVVMNNDVLVIQRQMVFTHKKTNNIYRNMVDILKQTIKNPESQKELIDAKRALSTIYVQQFRVH